MKIFGFSVVTIAIVIAAYVAGRKGWIAGLTSKVGA
jgi:hypothetical protein